MTGVTAHLELVQTAKTVSDLIGMDWNQYLDALDQDDTYDPLLCNRLGKAMRLAPSIIVYNALLEGQDVPTSALDRVWATRYGL